MRRNYLGMIHKSAEIVKGNDVYKMLLHIQKKKGATKYECATKVLGYLGTHWDLRGACSPAFQGLVDLKYLSLNKQTHRYTLTESGKAALLDAMY